MKVVPRPSSLVTRHVAVHRLDQLLHDRQAEPARTLVAGRSPTGDVETFEHVREIGRVDARVRRRPP